MCIIHRCIVNRYLVLMVWNEKKYISNALIMYIIQISNSNNVLFVFKYFFYTAHWLIIVTHRYTIFAHEYAGQRVIIITYRYTIFIHTIYFYTSRGRCSISMCAGVSVRRRQIPVYDVHYLDNGSWTYHYICIIKHYGIVYQNNWI